MRHPSIVLAAMLAAAVVPAGETEPFAALPADFPYEPHYARVHGSKMHFVDVGEGDTFLFLHGNPTWSYTWRNVIPHILPRGRAVAVDLIGMGRSDKPDIEYRFFDHVKYLDGFIRALELRNVTLVVHDWGSALGFHYARRHEANVRGIAFMEAGLAPYESWEDFPASAVELFKQFRTPELGWKLIAEQNAFLEGFAGSVARGLSDEEVAHYREPFPTPASRKPVWRWPNEIPIGGEPQDVHDAVVAYNRWLQETEVPKLLLHATPGVIIGEDEVRWCRDNLKNLNVVDLGEGRHFLQEEHPHEIGNALARWHRLLQKRARKH